MKPRKNTKIINKSKKDKNRITPSDFNKKIKYSLSHKYKK